MSKSWNSTQKWFCLLGLIALAGCTDGLMYKMKSVNPYYRKEWEKDRQYGITFNDQVEELQYLQSQLPGMDASKKTQWSEVLERVIKGDGKAQRDPSPELRTLAVQTIANLPGPATVRALNSASTDESEKVRLAACQAWMQLGGTDAKHMLMTLASNPKETPSIRRAATDALSAFPDADVRNSLAAILDDKSPALQYQAALSLKKITGRDYGGDIDAWREYMQGKDVPEPEKSMMASFWESLSWER